MLTGCGTMLGWRAGSGKTSVRLPKRGASPSTVKNLPTSLFWPLPKEAMASKSAWVIVPNDAEPSERGGATGGTLRSLIIHPSYQPDSLLITNRPEHSMNTSIAARGSLTSVGRPGLGSKTTRTEPMVGNWPLAALAAVGIAPSLIPFMIAVKTLGWKWFVSSREYWKSWLGSPASLHALIPRHVRV